jgi:adenylate cyclase, class 2
MRRSLERRRQRRVGERRQCAAGPARRNIELKALDPAQGDSLDTCRAIGAVDHGTIWQRDTYFRVHHGRLKLRTPESSYRITQVNDAHGLGEALAAALGVDGVVEKRRHLFLWRRVRIHFDDAKGLGRFIELEAVAPPGSDLSEQRTLIAQLREAFDICEFTPLRRRLCGAVLQAAFGAVRAELAIDALAHGFL